MNIKPKHTVISEFEVKDKINANDIIKISVFKKEIGKTAPHKHNNYYEIIYLSKGCGSHTIDSQKFLIKPPTLFIIRKEQVHHWNIENEAEGFVIIIKKSFIEGNLDKEITQLFSKISAFTCMHPKDATTIEQLLELLNKESQEMDDGQSMILRIGLLKALFAKILQSEPVPITKLKVFNNMRFQMFIDLLTDEKVIINKVDYYATLLNTTPQNLNAICRKEAEKSASQIISEFMIVEANRFLLYTDLTISEISHSLEFKDISNFTKYFKKHTSYTPTNFRKLNK